MQGGPLRLRVSLPLVVFLIICIAVPSVFFIIPASGNMGLRCRQDERRTLLDFKRGLTMGINGLPSWVGDDCCAWSGINCSASTGHVVGLDLRLDADDYELAHSITGISFVIPPHLGNLTDLQYLSSRGNFGYSSRSLHWLSHLSSLRYLDMRGVDLSRAGDWLHSLNSLPNLKVLNLNDTGLPRDPPPASLPLVNLSSLTTLGRA